MKLTISEKFRSTNFKMGLDSVSEIHKVISMNN